MTDRELIERAVAAADNSYSPYSRFRVGAALECVSGAVYTGANIENAAFGATICAEQAAVAAACSAGVREFRRIAIFSEGTAYTFPCGTCRQVLAEFSPDMDVLSARGDGRYVSYSLASLLPAAFSKENL